MQFYSQTLSGIPKEFLSHQKNRDGYDAPETEPAPKTEDLLFILTVLLFLDDGQSISEPD